MIPIESLLFVGDEYTSTVEEILSRHFGSEQHMVMTIMELLVGYQLAHRELLDYLELFNPTFSLELTDIIVHKLLQQHLQFNNSTSQTLQDLLDNGVSVCSVQRESWVIKTDYFKHSSWYYPGQMAPNVMFQYEEKESLEEAG